MHDIGGMSLDSRDNELPNGEKIVGVTTHKDTVIIYSNKHVYRLVDNVLTKVRFVLDGHD